MPAKPSEIKKATIHTYWDSKEGLICPLCSSQLQHEFNNGGRKIITLKGPVWVVTNYYSCINPKCEMHEAFPAAYHSAMQRKRFSLEVWAKVIQHHFKHHLNYSTTVELMWDDWDVSISRNTVRSICEFFEMAGKQYTDKKVLKEVGSSGRIVLSLDGAQPVKNEPSLWVFSDRLTGNVLLARNLESAPASTLCAIFQEIEMLYSVPIVAIISDKQKSIVNSVKQFKSDIPHAYCQYHFLNHIAEPIASKDSHLKKTLRKFVKQLSIVQNSKRADSNGLYKLFHPISEELKCAISTRGDRFDVFPGIEAYANLEFVVSRLEQFEEIKLTPKVSRSFNTLLASLRNLLRENRYLREEIMTLMPDFLSIRKILAKREKKASQIEKEVKKWVYKLQGRLKRRKLESIPQNIKWQQPSFKLSCEEIWQQWIRLVNSYSEGLYEAYDVKELDFTNNAKEQLFHRSKHHFKALLGRENVARAFLNHGGLHVQLLDIDFTKKNVTSVLLACETPLIEAQRKEFNAQYATVRRTWRIREKDTGNFTQFKDNLTQLECS
ncbi:hypothetical protein LCGC14_0807310 [marine sediment metagenome]|uniref:MULE transposase domain-containing protein n=1 Tax=marine sediment metagenome TaxID=412755 RepID=A0A0F9MMI6_9ZZZZ